MSSSLSWLCLESFDLAMQSISFISTTGKLWKTYEKEARNYGSLNHQPTTHIAQLQHISTLCQWYHVLTFPLSTSSLLTRHFFQLYFHLFTYEWAFSRLVWSSLVVDFQLKFFLNFPYMCNERGEQSMQIYAHGWDIFSPKKKCCV